MCGGKKDNSVTAVEAVDAEGKNAVNLNDSSVMADQEIHADLNLESLKRKLGSKMRKQVEAAFFK